MPDRLWPKVEKITALAKFSRVLVGYVNNTTMSSRVNIKRKAGDKSLKCDVCKAEKPSKTCPECKRFELKSILNIF